MTRRIRFYDTTMRDGEATPGNAMDRRTKIELAEQLDCAGIDLIEPGFPAASPADLRVFGDVTSSVRNATVSGFCRASKDDIELTVNAADPSANIRIQILTTASELHLLHKRHLSESDARVEAEAAVRYAKQLGVADVTVALEDATRGSIGLLSRLCEAMVDAGATGLVIPDTVGCCLPNEYSDVISLVRTVVGESIHISAHTHNDLGLGTANAIAAINAGADEVQATLAGFGERAGNSALEEVLAVVLHKGESLGVESALSAPLISDAALWLVDRLSVPLSNNKPIIGRYAFTTQAGMHQAAILDNPETYEFVEATKFGRCMRFAYGRLSGRSAIRAALKPSQGDPADDVVQAIYERLIGSADVYDEEGLARLYADVAGSDTR